MNTINTHKLIDKELCGEVVQQGENFCRIVLKTIDRMSVDEKGLVHGGFVFGLADYAAMLAVNDPNVVLGSAESRFLKPVQVGDTVTAEASVVDTNGKKRMVKVTVIREEQVVFEGTFTCFVLDHHVLG